MTTIWKFPVHQKIQVPKGGIPVFAGLDPQSELSVWIEVETEKETEERAFSVFGTGAQIPDHAIYVSSHLTGPFVWHVYEVKFD